MMGLFWDLYQQSRIRETQHATESLQQRVARLELELDRVRRVQQDLILLLEERFGKDIDNDGRIGR
jgi:hypothetical protein